MKKLNEVLPSAEEVYESWFESLPSDQKGPVLMEATQQLLADRRCGIEGPWWIYLGNALYLLHGKDKPDVL